MRFRESPRGGLPIGAATVALLGLLGLQLAGRPTSANQELGRAVFHHFHLVQQSASGLVDYYERLFAPGSVKRGRFWGIDGLRDDAVLLLVSPPVQERASDLSTTVWHFGWGKTSPGETYAYHLANEVNWRPPYATLSAQLHFHLQSRNAEAAARWYREVLGAIVEHDIGPADMPQPASRPASTVEALVRFGGIVLLIQETDQEISSTRDGGRVDHLAFQVESLEPALDRARAFGSSSVEPHYRLEGVSSAMVSGPDGIVLELLERPKSPAFWHERPR